MATTINYCPPPCPPVLRRCRVPGWWGKISLDYPGPGSDMLGNSPVSDQSKISCAPCSVRVKRHKLSTSALVWDVEKVLMEDQTVQLLYQGVKVREGDSEDKVGISESEIIETNGREQVVRLQKKKFAYFCPKCRQAFKYKTPLLAHILSHYYTAFFKVLPNSKPFACPICGKLNRAKIILARHYAFTHKKIFDLTELTPEDLSLQGHVEEGSNNPVDKKALKNNAEKKCSGTKMYKKQYECEEFRYREGGKETSDSEEGHEEVLDVGLSVEVKKIKKKEQYTFYECPKCGQSFKDTVSNVRRHILSHYQQVFFDVLPDKMPLKCPICDMCFKWRGSLVRHFAFSHQKIFELTDLTPEDLLYSKIHMKKKNLEQKLWETDEKRMAVLSSSLLNAAEAPMEMEDSQHNTVTGIIPAPFLPTNCTTNE